MSGPFSLVDGRVSLHLEEIERTVLGTVPLLIDRASGAVTRLDYSAHPNDAEADSRYRELVAGDLEALRRGDRSGFESVVAGEPVDPEVIEAFMRVVGDARLVLADHLGIEDDGWEYEDRPDDPELGLLGWLGYLQEMAVTVLMDLL